MKKLLFLFLLVSATLRAEVYDAFKGVYPVTDKAFIKSLNGVWDIKVVDGIGQDTSVPEKDASWTTVPVPGCWEQYGLCKARYSFPDSLTGYYRTEFTVPSAWKGKRVVMRLDGVLRGYDLWINGQKAGTWEQAYNTCLFDITPFLTKKAFKGEAQRLAMRVYSRFQGFEFDCADDWAPMGIFRDVTLFAAPEVHLSGMTVTTSATGRVTLQTEVANAGRKTAVEARLTDAEGTVTRMENRGNGLLTATVSSPKLWTAETPYLYTLQVDVLQKGRVVQTFSHKVGIRELRIKDGKVLELNGKPIKFRGVTSHATDPVRVKVIGEELTLKDMKLMKEASINYIRTSHYPREPRFYELADSLGFYIVNEVPFASRGEKHLKKPSYYDILRTRTKATIDRDKNHASVMIWSLGNENPLPESCQRIGEYAKSLDTTRMICYPQKGSYFRSVGFRKFPAVADIYAPHYPTTSQLRDFYTKTDRPLIFTEYCHTLGISFEDHDRQWEIIERTPGIAGGSIWEWVDQGMPFQDKLKDRYGYEERVFTSENGGFEMHGNQGTDGLLYADRTPLPNYYELQHNYALAAVTDTLFRGSLHVRNRHDFLNLKDNVDFCWELTSDGRCVASGSFSPDCPPRSEMTQTLAVPQLVDGALGVLNVTIRNKAGYVVLRQALRVEGHETPALTIADGKAFPVTGSKEWNDYVQGAPMVRVGRKPTMAENMKVAADRIEKYLQPMDNPYVRATVEQKGNTVSYTLVPDTVRRFLSELGVAYLMSPRFDRVQWIGKGPYATYPGRKQAGRYGFWALQKDDIYFEGNRMNCDAVWVSDSEGNGVVFECDGGNVSFEQTDRGIVITVNAAVSGQGPKFARTAFGVWSDKTPEKTGSFRMYATRSGSIPKPFAEPKSVKAPFKPFLTQYDTYLMRFADILGGNVINGQQK